MKKLLSILLILAASVSLKADTEGYLMLSVFHPGQIPIAATSLDGLRFNVIYGECMNLNGLDLGVVGHVRERMNGFQCCLGNSAGTDAAGFQLGLWNTVSQDWSGFQLGCFNNVGNEGAGFQLGLWNQAKTFTGFQLGLLNFAGKAAKEGDNVADSAPAEGGINGLQIGLLNFIATPMQTYPLLPFVNWCF